MGLIMVEEKMVNISSEEDLKIFEESIKDIKENDTVNIILHDIPDPDAISCGWAIKTILNTKGIKAEMYHRGEVSHTQNITMNNLLHIPLNHINDNVEGINICVDCTPKNSCVNEAHLVIDHHENNPDAKYVINHPNFGSCATIVWDIVKHYIEDMSEYKALATALLIGIRTDTKDMSSENISPDDFRAWQELYLYSDIEKVQKIINYDKPRYYYEKLIEMNKENNCVEKDGFIIGGVGLCSSKQRDVIAMLADEYLRQEGTNTTVIFCITDKKYIDISMRTRLSSVNVGNFLQKAFGSSAGGTSFQGGARIPVGEFFKDLDEDEIKEFWSLVCKRIFKLTLVK
jgi:nanoRNase/pAp phosphatase (c-di-AMP/oligoRNAs hydrolase)